MLLRLGRMRAFGGAGREIRGGSLRLGKRLAFGGTAGVVVAVTLGACGGEGEDRHSVGADPVESAEEYELPAGAPGRFGFGSEASEERVAAWDIDVRPDGVGLPAGGGTAVEGRRVYFANCVACHGATGTEGPNDRLVGGAWPEGRFPEGRTVGSYWPYATTVFDYVRRAMPQDRPGVLTSNETYAVVAWILAENGIIEPDEQMDATTLPAVEMPARDRFVTDDRTGGETIR